MSKTTGGKLRRRGLVILAAALIAWALLIAIVATVGWIVRIFG